MFLYDTLPTSTNLRPAWRNEDSSSAWTLATLILSDGDMRGMGESAGGRGKGDEGEEGRVGGKSW